MVGSRQRRAAACAAQERCCSARRRPPPGRCRLLGQRSRPQRAHAAAVAETASAVLCPPVAGVLRLPRQKPHLGERAVRHLSVPRMQRHPPQPRRACQLRAVSSSGRVRAMHAGSSVPAAALRCQQQQQQPPHMQQDLQTAANGRRCSQLHAHVPIQQHSALSVRLFALHCTCLSVAAQRHWTHGPRTSCA